VGKSLPFHLPKEGGGKKVLTCDWNCGRNRETTGRNCIGVATAAEKAVKKRGGGTEKERPECIRERKK